MKKGTNVVTVQRLCLSNLPESQSSKPPVYFEDKKIIPFIMESNAVSYRNINSILRDRKARVMITGADSGKVSLSRLPEDGEEVGIETDFAEYIRVEIHSSMDFGNTCHGAAKDHVYKGPPGEMELIIDKGELIEFSHSKIYAIHRG